MLKKYVTLILFVLFVFVSSNAVAHTCGPGLTHSGTGHNCSSSGGPPNPPGVPIDGGVGILLVLGIGYAASKLKDKR